MKIFFLLSVSVWEHLQRKKKLTKQFYRSNKTCMENKKRVWSGNPELKDIEWMQQKTLSVSLGIKVKEIGPDFISGTMPVDERTKQPFGICHGGAYVALAEELGSIASWLIVDRENFVGVGVEINANHLKAVKSG